MKPVIVESEHVGAPPTVEDQATSGMMVGGLNGSLRGGALPSLAGGFFLARSTKNFIRISYGFLSVTLAGGGIYGGHSLTGISTFGDG